MRSAFRIDSMTLMRTRSLVRRISTKRDLDFGLTCRMGGPSLWSRRGIWQGNACVGIVVPLEDKSADRLIEPLTTLVASDMAKVNQTILSRSGSEVTMIPEVANHLIASGGKRMRPILSLATAGLCGYAGEGHIKLAAAVEFMHTATLLHDDVVDESDLRRGKPTSNAAFGNASSVLVGDFLYSRSFQMMVDVDNMRVMRILADATNRIAEGEVLQLMNIHDPTVDEARYLRVVECKTAPLFEASARLRARRAGRPPGGRERARA